MMDITQDIKNYIYFLQEHFGLSISLHPYYHKASLNSTLMRFGIHCNDYCMCMKTNDELWQICIANQKKVREKAKCGSFFGMCHAGVYEYVYPYMIQGEEGGFICVSGYGIDNEKSRAARKRICKQFNFPEETVDGCYHSLNRSIPSKRLTDSLLHPLCHMLELHYLRHPDFQTKENDFYNEMFHYINTNHTSKITVDDLCRRFHCSRSTISHTFKANNGMSISDYVNKLRLDDAKALLRNTRLNITAVSALVGFADANYFSNIFKHSFGLSPLQYRKQFHR